MAEWHFSRTGAIPGFGGPVLQAQRVPLGVKGELLVDAIGLNGSLRSTLAYELVERALQAWPREAAADGMDLMPYGKVLVRWSLGQGEAELFLEVPEREEPLDLTEAERLILRMFSELRASSDEQLKPI